MQTIITSIVKGTGFSTHVRALAGPPAPSRCCGWEEQVPAEGQEIHERVRPPPIHW